MKGVAIALLSGLAAAVGCGDRTVSPPAGTGDGDSGYVTPSASTEVPDSASGLGSGSSSESTSDSSGSTDMTTPPAECHTGFPWLECDICTHIGIDVANCGECDRSCRGADSTCTDFKCSPGLWPCIAATEPLPTCADACATVGEVCSETAECAGRVGLYLTGLGVLALNACMSETHQSYNLTDVGCNDALDWDFVLGNGEEIVGLACCCTQPP